MPPAISPPPTVSFSQGTRQLRLRTAPSSPIQGAANECERVAEEQQVGEEIGDEAESDEQRWDDQLPEAAQGAPRRQQLDRKEGEQREPGEPRCRGQPAQQPRPEPALVARGQHGTERQRTEEGLRVTDE